MQAMKESPLEAYFEKNVQNAKKSNSWYIREIKVENGTTKQFKIESKRIKGLSIMASLEDLDVLNKVYQYVGQPVALKRNKLKSLQESDYYDINSGQKIRKELKTEDTAMTKVYNNTKAYERAVPYPLRNKNQWVCMKLTWDESKGKFAKLPINPNAINGPIHYGKDLAKVNDKETWGSFDKACQAASTYELDGIAFVFTPNDKIVGIDLDKDKNGQFTEAGLNILAELKGKTYIEHSASGAIHIFGYATKPGNYKVGMKDSTLEMFGAGQNNLVLMITGNVYNGEFVKLNNIQEYVDKLYEEHFKRPEVTQRAATAPSLSMSDQEVIKTIQASEKERHFNSYMRGDTSLNGGDYNKSDLALCGIIAFVTQDPNQIDRIYRQSGLYNTTKYNPISRKDESRAVKWDSKREGGTYGSNTINLAIRGVYKKYNPAGYAKEKNSKPKQHK